MDYNLYDIQASLKKGKQSTIAVLKKLSLLIKGEKKNLIVAFVVIIINSGLKLVGPLLIGIAIDKYVQTGQMQGVLVYSGILQVIYAVVLCANYLQTQLLGVIGQRMVDKLRPSVLSKHQA